jgi:hypothetical protein
MDPTQQQLATLRQIADESQIRISWLYQRSRRNALPGLRRLGRHCRVDRREFFAALAAGRIE